MATKPWAPSPGELGRYLRFTRAHDWVEEQDSHSWSALGFTPERTKQSFAYWFAQEYEDCPQPQSDTEVGKAWTYYKSLIAEEEKAVADIVDILGRISEGTLSIETAERLAREAVAVALSNEEQK